VKVNPSTHKGMHSVLALKLGVTATPAGRALGPELGLLLLWVLIIFQVSFSFQNFWKIESTMKIHRKWNKSQNYTK
jgi:hypothetical protein